MTFDGIGPIRMGGSLSAPVTAALTEESNTATDPARCRFFAGGEIDPVVISRGMTPDVIGGIYLPGKEASTGYPRTFNGIGTGMTAEELLAAHPDARPSGEWAPPGYAITNGTGRYIHFTVDDDGVITGIYLEETPTLTWEYCD